MKTLFPNCPLPGAAPCLECGSLLPLSKAAASRRAPRSKHLIAVLFLFAGTGLLASAQDAPAASSVEARLAARRAAEELGATAAPAAPTETAAEPRITPITPIPPIATNLQVVWQRNVFDRARVPYTPRTYRPPPVIESFSLRGISEIVGKGFVALFGGNGVPSYPPSRVVGDLLGGDNGRQFKITAITLSNVTLLDTKFTPRPAGTSAAGRTNSAPAGPEFVLNLDEQLTRTDGGPWTTNAYIPVYPTFAARSPLDRPDPSAAAPPTTPMNPRVPRSGPSAPSGPRPVRTSRAMPMPSPKSPADRPCRSQRP